MEDLKNILSQKFSYLTEGLQSVVYVSEDQKYILKTFKNLEESREQFSKWGLDPNEITSELITISDISYNLAFDKIREQTALLHLHMDKSEIGIPFIQLGDKEVNPTELNFLIQEKVELVRDRLSQLMSGGQLENAKKVFDDIILFITKLWEKGITEDTFNWDHNYGYGKDGNLVQIDVGTFREGKQYIDEEIKNRKLLDSVSSRWLEEKFPELFPYYREKAEEFYSHYDC